MIRRITKTLLVASISFAVAYVAPSAVLGWSLNPFAPKDDEAQTRPVSMNKTQKSPTAWDKVSTGTKNFFSKTGEALGLKKKEPKKAPAVVAPKQRQLVQKPKKSAGWFGSKEDDGPKSVPDWMQRTKPATL